MWRSKRNIAKTLFLNLKLWVKSNAICQATQLMTLRTGILVSGPYPYQQKICPGMTKTLVYTHPMASNNVGYNVEPEVVLIKPADKDEIADVYFRSCQAFIQVQGLAGTIIVGTVDVVLLLRVHALYGNSKRMLIFLIPLILCEIISMAVISIFSDLPLKSSAHFDGLLGCYALYLLRPFSLAVPRFLTFYNIPALAVVRNFMVFFILQIVLITTTVIYNVYFDPLQVLFARDGIIWFIAVLLIASTNIVIWAAGRSTLAENVMRGLAQHQDNSGENRQPDHYDLADRTALYEQWWN
ncbi:hypothetical protein B0H12DRAFT_1078637 [Mycena haematopus]|nr:hypothetical protein B0H12DRAFT_1078637 [Mycena haematopus]